MIPRRIAYVVKHFPKLSETFILEELVELHRRGVELRICSLNRPEEAMHHPVVGNSGLLEHTTYGIDQFYRVLDDFRPDLIHAHFATQPTANARALAVHSGAPFTFTAHGYDVYRKPPSDFHERAAAAAAVITVSHANADFIHHQFRVPRDAIRIVPCGIDTSRFTPGAHRCHSRLVLCVARMSPVKNLELLLQSCALLKKDAVKFRCVVIGDGRCRPDLEMARGRLDLEGTVFFVGSLDQIGVIENWKRATVGVLTSHSEGMPVSLMEAAACGVPVVATNVGGISELIQNGTTGFVTPPNDPVALAAALKVLLNDKTLADQMGREARARSEKLFSVKHQVDSLLSIWSRVCSERVTL